jgi:molybdate transport system ATP-binding protein
MTLVADLGVRLDGFELAATLSAERGGVVAVLGPNGAGKTTALRTLAGLLALDEGSIELDGEVLDDPRSSTFVRPERRKVGVVFQDYLLFPHLSALDNVAFGLRSQGAARHEASAAARTWLERMGVEDQAGSRPRRLSGGQAQRVALARALATDPNLLLLDEPLAALDAGTRTEVRRDLRHYLDEFGGATVLVTHDPVDALTLADAVVILEDGRVVQAGPLDEVTTRPRSSYVAQLIGTNLFRGNADGTSVGLDGGGEITIADQMQGAVFVVVPPNAISLYASRPDGSPRNQWPAVVAGLDLLGDRVRVRLNGAIPAVAEITPSAVADLGLRDGTEVWAVIKATEISTYPV